MQCHSFHIGLVLIKHLICFGENWYSPAIQINHVTFKSVMNKKYNYLTFRLLDIYLEWELGYV